MSKLFQVAAAGLIVAVLAASTGCTSGSRAADSSAITLSPPDPAIAKQGRTVKVFRGADGAAVDWESLVSAAAGADAVVIGENHGHKLGLAFASDLWADVLSRRDQAVLSMEFFERNEQSRLDDYLKGLWDEPAFLKATRRTTDAVYPPGHRSMVEAARAHARPVIAANAPRVYVTAARRNAYEKLNSLTPEQRRMFRIPDELPTGKYRTDFDALMSNPAMVSHNGPPTKETPEELRSRLDAAFRAQSLWDWTMADSVAHAIDQDGRPVVHVVGRFHSDFAGGLVQALRKLRSSTAVTTVSVVDAWSDVLQPADRDRADFVVYVGTEEE